MNEYQVNEIGLNSWWGLKVNCTRNQAFAAFTAQRALNNAKFNQIFNQVKLRYSSQYIN